MIAKAIIKDGGLFIPNVELAALHSQQEVRIQFEILSRQEEEDIFDKTAGLSETQEDRPAQISRCAER